MGHVADGVKVDQEADAGHYQDHHRRKRIEQQPPFGDEVDELAGAGLRQAGRHPLKQDFLRNALSGRALEQLPDCAQGEHEGDKNTADAHGAHGGILQPLSHQQHQSGPGKGKKRNEPDLVEKKFSRH